MESQGASDPAEARGRVVLWSTGLSGSEGPGYLRLVGDPADATGRDEIVVAMFPRDRERIQDQPLRGLSTGAALLDGVNRSGRYTGGHGEFVLGPAECLSSGANPIHGVLAGLREGVMIAPPSPNRGCGRAAPKGFGPCRGFGVGGAPAPNEIYLSI